MILSVPVTFTNFLLKHFPVGFSIIVKSDNDLEKFIRQILVHRFHHIPQLQLEILLFQLHQGYLLWRVVMCYYILLFIEFWLVIVIIEKTN